MKDRIETIWSAIWNRKTTLFLLVLGQAVNLYIWQMQSLTNIAYLHANAAFVVALLTAFALDSAQVQIAVAPKTKRIHWIIAAIASVVFLTLGMWIAIDVMNDALHAAFAIGVFMYSWYDALVHTTTTTVVKKAVAPAQSTTPRTTIKIQRGKYACPNCNAAVTKGSYYRVKQRGYCNACKGV